MCDELELIFCTNDSVYVFTVRLCSMFAENTWVYLNSSIHLRD